MEDNEKRARAEFADKVAILRKDPTFDKVINAQIVQAGKAIIDLAPNQTAQFTGLQGHRAAMFTLLNDMDNAIAEGVQLRKELDPDYVRESLHAV